MTAYWPLLLIAATALVSGCQQSTPLPEVPEAAESSADTTPEIPTAPPLTTTGQPGAMTIRELRKALGVGDDQGEIRRAGGQVAFMDLRGTPVSDLSALQGLPVRDLFLEETRVTDLSPLAGMPLDRLYLSETAVEDLSPLAGMDLAELNLVGTSVKDLSPLKDVGIGTLWIPETQVTDLTPLAGKSIESLDLRDCPVSDLSPLAGNRSLKRLHIAGTNVTDLTPLAGLQLERLIFSPEKIEKGMSVIQEMQSLTGLDTSFDGGEVMRPEEFWNLYEAGDLDQ